MSRQAATRLAWSLWALSVLLTVAMFVLYLLSLGVPLEDRDRPPLEFIPVMAGMLLAFATVGALVATRHPGNPVGWLLCAVALAAGIAFAAQFYAEYALIAKDGSIPGGPVGVWLNLWTIAPALTAMTLFALVFPSGRLLSSRWRPVAWVALGGGLVLMASLALDPGVLDDRNYPGVRNPLGLPGTSAVIEIVETVATGCVLLALVAAVASLVVRFRRSVGPEREQLKWIVYSGTLAAVAFIVVLPINVSPWDDVAFVIAFCSLISVPVATGIAILRHRLYDIDVVINRTLVYGALTATLAGMYLGLVLLLQLAFQPLTQDSDLAIAGSTLAVAALFRPLRSRIQTAVDHRFYRRKYDATQTLEAFAARLRDEIDLDALRDELAGVVRETMQPAHLSLWLRAEQK